MENLARENLAPQLLSARVMHKRLQPRTNMFCYNVYFLKIPLKLLEGGYLSKSLAVNRFSVSSFHLRDHGYRDGSSLQKWAENILAAHDIPAPDNIALICIPRILGYVFNPVSFWACYDEHGDMRAVICEVNNTFGETHAYICAHDDHRIIQAKDCLESQKLFHVSPFLKREGCYRFRFDITDSMCSIQIDYFDEAGQKTLMTSLNGSFMPLSASSLRRAFWKHPLMAFKVIMMIHYQALKLALKGVRYIAKPSQLSIMLSRSGHER